MRTFLSLFRPAGCFNSARNFTFDAMRTYLMSGLVRRGQLRPVEARQHRTIMEYQTWVACPMGFVFGETLEEAQKKFETALCRPGDDKNPMETEIKKIVVAPLIPELFTEAGPAPLDWPALCDQDEQSVLAIATSDDDFGRGYWVDLGSLQWPEPLSASIDDLRRELPEDISSGLNWSPDKQYLCVLSLMTPPPEFPAETETNVLEPNEVSDEEAQASADEMRQMLADHPEAGDKQAAAVIQARNSVAAAWLWRRYAAEHQLSVLPFQLDPWCGVVELPPRSASSAGNPES